MSAHYHLRVQPSSAGTAWLSLSAGRCLSCSRDLSTCLVLRGDRVLRLTRGNRAYGAGRPSPALWHHPADHLRPGPPFPWSGWARLSGPARITKNVESAVGATLPTRHPSCSQRPGPVLICEHGRRICIFFPLYWRRDRRGGARGLKVSRRLLAGPKEMRCPGTRLTTTWSGRGCCWPRAASKKLANWRTNARPAGPTTPPRC